MKLSDTVVKNNWTLQENSSSNLSFYLLVTYEAYTFTEPSEPFCDL